MKKALLLLVLLVVTAGAHAQSDLGNITGTVTDPSGAVVSEATVTIINKGTGLTRVQKTNSAGQYSTQGLPPGEYEVDFAASGFTTEKRSITVAVGSANVVDAKISVGGGQEQVEVAADSVGGVQLENAEISQVVDSHQITELPSLNRNPYDFVSVSGNISSDPSGGNRGVGFNFSGSRSASVDILLDGAENTNVYGVSVGQTVPLDAVSEYRVITSGMGAQYGRASGGIVNAVTKSGTNSFHGSLWEFNRVAALASTGYENNAIGVPKSPFTRNEFGYAVGGPIIKDKLFFFSSTEWLRVRSSQEIVAEVPDPALIAASGANTQAFFAQYGKLAYQPNSTVYTLGYLVSNGPFAKDSAALTASNPAKYPSSLPAFDEVKYPNPGDSGAGEPQNTYDIFDRFDYTLSSKATLFGRYSLYSLDEFPGSNNTSPYAGYNTGLTDYDNNGLGALTYTFTPNLVSTSKVLFSRLNDAQPLGSVPVSPTLYVNGSSSVTLGNGTIYFPGYSATAPGNAIPFGGPQNFLQIIEDMSLTKGRHTVTFGGEYLYIKDNRIFGAYEEAVQALKQSGTSGALTNFVAGNEGLLQVAINPQGKYPCVRDLATGALDQTAACTLTLPVGSPSFSRSNRYHDPAFYVSDSYRASPRLTVEAGLRYELYGPQHSSHANLDSNFFFGAGTTEQEQIRNGFVQTRQTAPNGRLWNLNTKQFAPRFGMAYDLTGDGKTSLRGGFGIAYERNFNNVTFNVIQNPPNYGVVSFTSADLGGAAIPISAQNFGPFASGTGTKALSPVTLRAVDPKIKPAYTEFYNVSMERSIANDTTVSISYSGTRGIHNYSIANINRSYSGGIYLGDATTYGAALVTNRLNPQYSNINFRGADGDSYYNGVDIGLRSGNLLHQGLVLVTHYTFAHSTDNTSSTFTDGGSNNTNLGYLDPFNHALDHGNSDFDVRHRAVVSFVWALPYFKSTTGLKNRLLDGYEVSTVFNATTGTPFTEFDCGLAVTVCPRASFNQKPQYKRNGNEANLSSTFGPNTFAYITFPTYTASNYTMYAGPLTGAGDEPTIIGGEDHFAPNMTQRNAFSGPGQWNQDADIIKNIKLYHESLFQIRAEAYNLFNHANTFLNVGGTNDVSTYNYALAYKNGRRTLQLAARLTF